jgi:hypothetical protein
VSILRMAMTSLAALGLFASEIATAIPLPFTATLRLEIGNLPPVVATGGGTADFTAGTGDVRVPAGVMGGLQGTFAITPPALGIVYGAAVGQAGAIGKVAPFAAGSNQKLTWSGKFGYASSPLAASFYLLNAKNKAMGALPLGCIGALWDATCGPSSVVLGSTTIFSDRFRLGMQTVTGAFPGAARLSATGFDNRNPAGVGVLQMVSANTVTLGPIGTLPILATYTFTFVPEPTTALLLAAGLGALALLRARVS